MSARKIGLAILGLGRMGSTHLNNLMVSPRAAVKSVMVARPEAAKTVLSSFDSPPQIYTPDQFHLILEDKSIEGILICTPTSQHEGQVKAALHAGKAVFSEKPITAEVQTTRSCYELAESRGIPLLCAFNRRFDPSFMAVKTKLTTKAAGRLRLVRSSSHDEELPPISYIKSSGGILKDSTVHDLDMALWLSASPAKKVFALGHAFDPAVNACGDLDLVLVLIEHASGSLSLIDNGRRCAHGYDQRLEAICDEGSFVVTNRHTDMCFQHTTEGSRMPRIDRSFVTRYPHAYLNEMDHFLDVMTTGCELKVTKSDVLSVMLLAEAAANSARSGRPVDLN